MFAAEVILRRAPGGQPGRADKVPGGHDHPPGEDAEIPPPGTGPVHVWSGATEIASRGRVLIPPSQWSDTE